MASIEKEPKNKNQCLSTQMNSVNLQQSSNTSTSNKRSKNNRPNNISGNSSSNNFMNTQSSSLMRSDFLKTRIIGDDLMLNSSVASSSRSVNTNMGKSITDNGQNSVNSQVKHHRQFQQQQNVKSPLTTSTMEYDSSVDPRNVWIFHHHIKNPTDQELEECRLMQSKPPSLSSGPSSAPQPQQQPIPSDVKYKIQKVPLQNKLVCCVNSVPYDHSSELMMSLNDLAYAVVPTSTVARCMMIILEYIRKPVYDARPEHLALLKKYNNKPVVYGDNEFMVYLKDIKPVFSDFKTLMLQQSSMIREYHKSVGGKPSFI